MSRYNYNNTVIMALNAAEREALDYVDYAIEVARKVIPHHDDYLCSLLYDLNNIHSLRKKMRAGDIIIDVYPAPNHRR